MQNNLPKDPVMLLSFVNTQLRDFYGDLEEFCTVFDVDINSIVGSLRKIDYVYNPEKNQFI